MDESATGDGLLSFLPGEGNLIPFSRVWNEARTLADELRVGLSPGASVGIALSSSVESITALLALWCAGARVTSFAESAPSTREASSAGCSLLVVSEVAETAAANPPQVAASDLVRRGASGVLPMSQLAARHSEQPSRPMPEFTQFTSGSTGEPKGVRLSLEAIGANCVRVLERIDPTGRPTSVSWLPLSHDMGLVGMLLASLVSFGPRFNGGGKLVLIDPQHFRLRPYSWLRACAEFGAQVTASPPSALAATLPWVTRRSPGDLSSLRALIVGSEMVTPRTLREVSAILGQEGLAEVAVCPAYGCAEMSLAVSMSDPGQAPRTYKVGEDVLVSAGRPLPGVNVRIDRDALPIDTGMAGVGEIVLSGESLMQGYVGSRNVREHRSGDLGVMIGDEIVPSGRVDDWLELGGSAVSATRFESEAANLQVRRNCVAAMAFQGDLVVAYEPKRSVDLDEEIRRLARFHLGVDPALVVRLERNAFPLTGSGKMRRTEVRGLLVSRQLLP